MTREEALDILHHNWTRIDNPNYKEEELDEAFFIAIEALSADAVEVVRCKDCLMTKERDEYTGKVWCCRHMEHMDDMYYCADGLHREDGEA